MNTKSFEVLLHSQFAFEVCRPQVHDYEDCKQTNNPNARDPMQCRKQAFQVLSCYNQAEKMHPICLAPFNDARECLFKSDGNIYNCRDYSEQYVNCQKDQAEYKDFLAASTSMQRQEQQFDFCRYRGHFDKYMG